MMFTVMTAFLLLSGPAMAHPTHDHDIARPAPKVTPTVIPDTYPEVVEALRERATATETALEETKIADLLGACTNLTDLSKALVAKATTLPAEAQATVAETATLLGEHVDTIVSSASDGKLEDAKTALAATQKDIDALAKLAK